jgi:hypothetical protein
MKVDLKHLCPSGQMLPSQPSGARCTMGEVPAEYEDLVQESEIERE